MPGPTPKPQSTVARRNRQSTASTLRADAAVIAPELPDMAWHPMTLAWWRDLWLSPMAPEFVESDRHGLFQLAMLQNDFWMADTARERVEAAKEIRLQAQRFGLSPIDRRRLQWEIERTDEAVDRGAARRERQTAASPQPKRGDDPRLALVQ